MERSHPALVKAAKCTDGVDVADPACLEAMKLVNNLFSWLGLCLFKFPGMKKANLQSCLNWSVYLFRVRRDEVKWPKLQGRFAICSCPIPITAAHGNLPTRTLRNSWNTINYSQEAAA